MKALSLSLYTILFSFAFSAASAQVSASSEPLAKVDQSGEIIIMPFQFSEQPVELYSEKAPAKQIIRNVAQKRDAKMGKMTNGYYKMAGNHDWGTSMRLNSYGYVTTVTKAATPKLAATTEFANTNETIAQASATEIALPAQVQPVAFK